MNSITVFSVAWYLAAALFEIWVIFRFVKAWRPTPVSPPDSGCYPPALAVLSLRGSDPSLRECLRRLANQDYPDYRICIVIDSETDPTVAEVRAFLETKPRVRVDVCYLGRRRPHCSGKLSGILRATEHLASDIQVVAVVDADAILHRSCLRELVAPLTDPRVGMTHGNRWYNPLTDELSPLIRAVWNSYAIVLMTVFPIPWAGCMALRATHVRAPEYRSTLATAFVDDASTLSYMWKQGLTRRFVPEATLLNREGVTPGALYNFLVRQYLAGRIDHPSWFPIVLHNLVLQGTLALGMVLPLCVELEVASYYAFALLIGVTIVLPLVARSLVHRSFAKRQIELGPLRWRRLLLLGVCGAAMSATTLICTLHSLFARRIGWRGITYGFGGRHPVTVLHVEPLADAINPALHAEKQAGRSSEVPASAASAADAHAPAAFATHRPPRALSDQAAAESRAGGVP